MSYPRVGYDATAEAARVKRLGSDVQTVTITDALSEGPVEGLVDGEASVYLDGDQLVDSGSAGLYTSSTGYTATIDASRTSGSGPDYAIIKDKTGAEVFLNDLKETKTDTAVIRWLSLHNLHSASIVIEENNIETVHNNGTISGDLRVCVIDPSSIATQDFFYQSQKLSDAAKATPTMYNLKPIVRIKSGTTGESIWGSITFLGDGDYENADSSGRAKRAIVKIWYMSSNAIHDNDVWLQSANVSDRGAVSEIFIDRTVRCDIETTSSGNRIYIPSWTSSDITAKPFSLSSAVFKKGQAGGAQAQGKYPGSSLEFRTGTLNQDPFDQLGGVGSISFPVTLTGSELETFNSKCPWPTSVQVGYPTQAQVDALVNDSNPDLRAIRKTIVFGETLSGAQIAEVDEVRIHLEWPQGFFATNEENQDRSSGAAFHIRLLGSESNSNNTTDWDIDITAGAFDYWYRFGIKKTATSHVIKIPVHTFRNIRNMKLEMTRITPDGGSNSNLHTGKLGGPGADFLVLGETQDMAAVADSVKISQIICTINERVNYPYTACAHLEFSSQSFPQPPKRAYHLRGLKVKIPSNYTPRHLSATGVATYTGLWNGEFSDEGTTNASGLSNDVYYTDNPAWCFYDILINNRYGLGDFLTAQDINKFQLYKIAKYCDELVPAAQGGTEPRFTTNLYLTKATEAYKVLKDMATVFRAMIYWLDGELLLVQDSPASPIYNFSKSNIIEDSINSQTTGSKTRANQYTVLWNNPDSGYKVEPIILEDRQNIIDTGRIIPKKATAFGCTSEGQAIRYGRWKTWTAINQTEVLNFKTGINAAFLTPGDIVNVQQEDDTGVAFSGRITNSSNSAITLDRDIVTVSSDPQVDGGAAESFSFGSSGDYTYTLALLVLTRSVILVQDAAAVVTHSGTAYTYNRGDEVEYAKIAGTSTALIGTSDSDEQVQKNIANIQDDAGNDMLVEFRNSTTVETKSFTSSNVSVVNGVTQIAISSAFSGEIPDSTIWAIRETYKGSNTTPSYKEYKILGIKEQKDNTYALSCAEFYNSKFDTIDKDFNLASQDPVNAPESNFIPAPEAIYILSRSNHKRPDEEIMVQWDIPRNNDGTRYRGVRGYNVYIDPPIPGINGEEMEMIPIRGQRTQCAINRIPDGTYRFGVQTFSSGNNYRSKIKWQAREINDLFKVQCARTKEGIPSGIFANTESSKTGATFSFDTKDFAIRSLGAPGTVINNANQSTAATYQQVLTAMATSGKELVNAFIYFDADATTDYLKLVHHTRSTFQNTSLTHWYDYDQFVANSENIWTDCTNSADARVKVAAYSNKVEKSEGTTAFKSRFQVGDIIRIKTATNIYYAAKVAYIEDDNTLYTDMRLNSTNSEIISVDESKAVARNTLRHDYANDAIIAHINLSGGTYTHNRLNWSIDPNLQGLRALIIDANVAFLNYNSSDALQNETTITLTADAIAYSSPEFIITGNGFTQGSPAVSGSAQSSYIDASNAAVDGQTLTWQIHDGSGGIGYDSGSTLDFSVTVREATDQSESKTKPFKIVKVQDGSIGLDGKTARLDLSDYSILYNDNGQAPKFTGTTSVGGTVGEVTLNTKKEGSETNGWIKITVNTTNFTDPVFRIYYGSSPTYLVDSITQYSGWMDGTAGASTVVHYPVPTGYSNNLTTGSSVNINVDVAEKPANFNGSNLPASGDIKATDSCSLMSLVAGEVGRSISVSNPTHVFQAENDGTVESETKTGSGTTLEFLKGGLTATYVGGTGSHSYNSGSSPDPNEWRIKSAVSTDTHLTVGTPTGVSNNIVTIGDHAVTGGIDDTEVITYTIELGTKDGVKEYTAVQVFAKAKAGETPNNTGIVYMYKVSASDSTPTIASDFPTVTVGLTGTNSGKITSATNNQIGSTGWFIVPQNPGTNALWVVAATFNGTGSSDTIAYSEWTGATIISGADGTDGTHGLSTGIATLYQTTNSGSAPNDPSGNLTYTFATAAVSEGSGQSGHFNSWQAAAVSPTNSNKFQWRITAPAIATATASTDTIASNEWSDATISAQYVKGDDGDTGQRSIQGYIYFRVPDGDSSPFSGGTGTYTFSSGGLTALVNSAGAAVSSGWQNAAYEIEVAGDYDYFAARYYGIEATGGPHATISVDVTAAVAHTSFTGVVTFNSGTNHLQLNGNDLTIIDGGSITTGILKSQGTGTTSVTGSAFTSTAGHTYFNLTNGAIAAKNFRIDTSGNAELKGTIKATGGFIGPTPGTAWRVVGYNLMGGGYINTQNQKTYDEDSPAYDTNAWPNANVTIDSSNARIIIRETTSASAGVNRVVLGKLS